MNIEIVPILISQFNQTDTPQSTQRYANVIFVTNNLQMVVCFVVEYTITYIV